MSRTTGGPATKGSAIGSRLATIRELLGFFWAHKLWWLTPMVVILVAFGLLLFFAHGSAVAPFIYTLF